MSLMQYFWNALLMKFFIVQGQSKKLSLYLCFPHKSAKLPINLKKNENKNIKNYMEDVLRHLLLPKTSIKGSFQTFIYLLGQHI